MNTTNNNHIPAIVLPDGQHIGEIVDVQMKPLENGGDQIVLTLHIPHDGTNVTQLKKYHINTIAAKTLLIKEMKNLHIEIETRDDFVSKSDSLRGLKVKLNARTNENGFQGWIIFGEHKGPLTAPPEKFSW